MANNIAKLRGMKGLSQPELGNKIGVTRASVSYTEKHHLSVHKAKIYAEALGTDVFTVLGKDVLKIIPQTEEEKQAVIKAILE